VNRRIGRRVAAPTVALLLATVAAIGLAATVTATTTAIAAMSVPTIAGSWHMAPSFPSGVEPMSVVAGRDGRLYLFGFCDNRCSQRNGTVGMDATVMETYDPVARTWHTGVHPPAACGAGINDLTPHASALDAAGKIEIAGCWGPDSAANASTVGPQVGIFDPVAGTWKLQAGHAPWDEPLVGMTGRNGQVLWFSSALKLSNGAVETAGYRVLIDTNGKWTSGRSMGGYAPSDAAVVGLDGRVYALGGDRDCQLEFGPCHSAPIRVYTPSTNMWATGPSLPLSRLRLAAATDRRGRIFLLGGTTSTGSGFVKTVDVYNPATKAWSRAASIPAPTFEALATATSDGRIWLLGGYGADGSPIRTMEVFTPAA
jgi:N-acetylneuraminic acid mutarotase